MFVQEEGAAAHGRRSASAFLKSKISVQTTEPDSTQPAKAAMARGAATPADIPAVAAKRPAAMRFIMLTVLIDMVSIGLIM